LSQLLERAFKTFTESPSDVSVTIGAGPSATKNQLTSVAEALKAADAVLNGAKRSGRNGAGRIGAENSRQDI
jgi:PleD family two-component response regulator